MQLRELDSEIEPIDAGGELCRGLERRFEFVDGSRRFQVALTCADFHAPPIDGSATRARYFLESKGLGLLDDEPLEIDDAAMFDEVMERAGCVLVEDLDGGRVWRLIAHATTLV